MARWLILQLADSAFPAGGFAHSGGLEAALQLGEATTVRDFAAATLRQTGLGALPLLRAAHAGEQVAADARAHAFLSSHVANRASRTQGRAFAATCAQSFPEQGGIDAAIREGRLHGHLAPVFGAAAAALGVAVDEAAEVFLHLALRGVLSAAVRLGAVGPHEAQAIQRELAAAAEAALEASRGLTIDDVAQTAPILDLCGALHDRLYSRLFQS